MDEDEYTRLELVRVDLVTPDGTVPFYIQLLKYKCLDSNCYNCTYSLWTRVTGHVCTECKDYYELLEDGSCKLNYAQAVPGKVTEVAVLGSMAISGISSIFSSSSPTALWALMNQYLLIYCLLIYNVYVPKSIVSLLTEFEWFTLDFSFLDFIELPYFETSFLPSLNIQLEVPELHKLGYESLSFIVNEFNLLKSVALILFLHILFLPCLI